MNSETLSWATRWRIPYAAVQELATLIGTAGPVAPSGGKSEAAVQADIRLEAPAAGVRLFRNNVGVLFNEHGTPIRYGLANDSKAVNARFKSGDLIGWRRVTITPAHVGATIAQFVSRECKPSGWSYSGGAHEEAQARWAQLVTLDGGDACFATGRGTL